MEKLINGTVGLKRVNEFEILQIFKFESIEKHIELLKSLEIGAIILLKREGREDVILQKQWIKFKIEDVIENYYTWVYVRGSNNNYPIYSEQGLTNTTIQIRQDLMSLFNSITLNTKLIRN